MNPEQLLHLLDLERLDRDLFRGANQDIGAGAVFGGQVLGQALIAAGRTVADRSAHSLHSYFLRPGRMQVPIIYQVERVRDGGSFTTRRVVAVLRSQLTRHPLWRCCAPQAELIMNEFIPCAHVDATPLQSRDLAACAWQVPTVLGSFSCGADS